MISEEWKNQLCGWAIGKPSVGAIWMFGSYARGTQRTDSDLDLAVVVRARDGEDLAEWIFNGKTWEKELSHLLGVEVDLDIANPDISDEVVAPAIQRDGVLIFCDAAVRKK